MLTVGCTVNCVVGWVISRTRCSSPSWMLSHRSHCGTMFLAILVLPYMSETNLSIRCSLHNCIQPVDSLASLNFLPHWHCFCLFNACPFFTTFNNCNFHPFWGFSHCLHLPWVVLSHYQALWGLYCYGRADEPLNAKISSSSVLSFNKHMLEIFNDLLIEK